MVGLSTSCDCDSVRFVGLRLLGLVPGGARGCVAGRDADGYAGEHA